MIATQVAQESRPSGCLPVFERQRLEAEFKSEKVCWELRNLLLHADSMYREYGGRLRVIKILGDGIYAYGRVADVSPLTLPGVESAGRGDMYEYPAHLCARLCELFPMEDLSTATYEGDRIVLRVPWKGYRSDSLVLSAWREVGVVPGRVLHPRGSISSKERAREDARERARLFRSRQRIRAVTT